jgi:NitT/TauT family transport system ATP-binding protein
LIHSDEPIVLHAEDVSYTFREGEHIRALDSVGLHVHAGEFVSIVGPSGCGKSTLLRVLGGLLAPDSGRVTLDGQPHTAPHPAVGFVFQSVNLLPWRTVLRNITLPLEVAGNTKPVEAQERARSLVELVGLEGFENAYPRTLSGGMAQRVAIARALIAKPAILLMDEPFGALDALTRERMNLELLRIWHAHQVTAVLVTHSIQEAVFLGDRVLVMSPRPGRIRAEVPIPLPRPRRLDMIYAEAFGTLSRDVRTAIG